MWATAFFQAAGLLSSKGFLQNDTAVDGVVPGSDVQNQFPNTVDLR
jgi:hypothetical protein